MCFLTNTVQHGNALSSVRRFRGEGGGGQRYVMLQGSHRYGVQSSVCLWFRSPTPSFTSFHFSARSKRLFSHLLIFSHLLNLLPLWRTSFLRPRPSATASRLSTSIPAILMSRVHVTTVAETWASSGRPNTICELSTKGILWNMALFHSLNVAKLRHWPLT